jgi:hypothetical protein
MDYEANTYLLVTLSDFCDISTLQTVHPAVTYIGQVGQLTDIHRLGVSNQDWDQNKQEIRESLRRAGIVLVDVDKLQQRAKRNEEYDEL